MSESTIVTGLRDGASIPPSESARGQFTSEPLAPSGVFTHASILQIVFSFAAMLGVSLVGRVFYALRSFHVDPDLWWHLKNGETILSTHRWPVTDPYSFTVAGQHWRSCEWLGDVLFAAVFRAGGLRGLGALLIVLGSIFALALYYFTSVRCGNPKAAFLSTALLLNLANMFNLRPQMLGYVFLVLALIILERFRAGKRRAIWLLPLLMLVWINTHGSWIIGLAAIGVYFASGLRNIQVGSLATQSWNAVERRQLGIVLMLSAIAILITPYGAGLATYPFSVGSSLPVSFNNIQEWRPMVFNLPGDKLFLGLLLGFLLVQILSRAKWRMEELGLFLFGTVMAFLHARFLALYVIFFAPVFVVTLTRWIPRYDRTKEIYALNGTIILGMLGAMIWYFPSRSDYARIVDNNFPIAAVEFLNSHSIPEPMYNSYEFGGYLLWARGPQHKVFIDGRSEIYERAGVLSDQVALLNLKPASLTVLEKYNIQSCLLSPGEALSTLLGGLPAWQKVFEDNHSVLYVRRPLDIAGRPVNVPVQNADRAAGGI